MHVYKLANIIITLSFIFLGKSQDIKQNIQDICRTLIVDKNIINCFYDKQSLRLMGESSRNLKNDILLPLRRLYYIVDPSEDKLEDIFYKLQHVSNQIKSIDCKKKVVKKGVLKKIKKFQTTQAPASAEASVNEEWDGWTFENLQLMKQYYEEMQKELEEIRKLVD